MRTSLQKNKMFKAYIDPFVVTMDIKFISPELMLVESMQVVRYTDGRVAYKQVKEVGEVVTRDRDPMEHVFRLVSGEDEISVGFGYSDTTDDLTHQFNFIIQDGGSTGYAVRFYDHVYSVVERPHVGSISTTYNEKMDSHNRNMKHAEHATHAGHAERNYLADAWE